MPPLNPYICFILLVSLLLLATAVAMMISHVRAWRTFQEQQADAGKRGQSPSAAKGDSPLFPADAEEFNYRRRQFRRRMQTGAMLGLLAIALSVGHFLTFWSHSNWLELGFWGVTLLLACWLGLLALADMWATKQHFARQQDRDLLEKLKLEAEARRLAGANGDGKDQG